MNADRVHSILAMGFLLLIILQAVLGFLGAAVLEGMLKRNKMKKGFLASQVFGFVAMGIAFLFLNHVDSMAAFFVIWIAGMYFPLFLYYYH